MMRQHAVRAILAGILVTSLIPAASIANHTVPAPRWWWDLDDDRVPDEADSNIGYAPAGGNWTLEKLNDLTFATGEWRGRTRWDPFNANNGGVARASFRVDGISDPCAAFGPDDIALTCRQAIPRKDGTIVDFYDIIDIDTVLNLAKPFNYGPDDPGAGQFDFRGVAVHELGHGARLVDTSSCGDPKITMCSSTAPGAPSKGLRSLESDDIASANTVYPT